MNNISIKNLKEFLLKNPGYFNEDNEVNTINDVINFKLKNPKNIVYNGEYFLADIYCNEMWIVKAIDKPKFDKRRKTKLDIEAVDFIVNRYDNSNNSVFPIFNGYWKIPKLT